MPLAGALSCPGRGRRKILHSHGLPALWSNAPDCCERLARPCSGKPPSTFALPCPGPLGQTGLSPESCTVAPPRFGPRQAGHQIQAGLDIMDLKDADFSILHMPSSKGGGIDLYRAPWRPYKEVLSCPGGCHIPEGTFLGGARLSLFCEEGGIQHDDNFKFKSFDAVHSRQTNAICVPVICLIGRKHVAFHLSILKHGLTCFAFLICPGDDANILCVKSMLHHSLDVCRDIIIEAIFCRIGHHSWTFTMQKGDAPLRGILASIKVISLLSSEEGDGGTTYFFRCPVIYA